MREIFKSGSVGRAPGNRCPYLEIDHLSKSEATGAHIIDQGREPTAKTALV